MQGIIYIRDELVLEAYPGRARRRTWLRQYPPPQGTLPRRGADIGDRDGAAGGAVNTDHLGGILTMAKHQAATFGIPWSFVVNDARAALGSDACYLLGAFSSEIEKARLWECGPKTRGARHP